MQSICYLLIFSLASFTPSSIARSLTSADIALVTRNLSIPRTWTISTKKSRWNTIHSDTYCTVFISSSRRKWLGNFCISSNENFRSEMGVRDEVPEEEDWADRSRYEVGYWSVTPLAIYPMTPFILKPIKNYAAESDCYLDDGPVYRATSMCHTTIYELRKGVFLYTVFHVFDNVKRKQKAQLSDIRNLWINVGKKVRKNSKYSIAVSTKKIALRFRTSPFRAAAKNADFSRERLESAQALSLLTVIFSSTRTSC